MTFSTTELPFSLTAEGEECWQDFLEHLNMAEEFTLLLLFVADQRPVRIFLERLERICKGRVSVLHRVCPTEGESLPETVLPQLRQDMMKETMRAPFWLELYDCAEEEHALKELLARLNEQRDPLRQESCRPLIIVLPLDWQARFRETAPDLWAIRSYAGSVPSEYIATAHLLHQHQLEKTQTLPPPTEKTDLPYIQEWKRLMKLSPRRRDTRDTLLISSYAFESAMKQRRFNLAKDIAQKALSLSRHLYESSKNIKAYRDISIALDNFGDIAVATGLLNEAEKAYTESLDIRKKIINKIGENHETLRDLFVSLTLTGDIAIDRGKFTDAKKTYNKSLDTIRHIIAITGEGPTTLQDLAISLERIGDIAFATQNIVDAEQAYTESLEIRNRVVGIIGKTHQTLRDLSISMEKSGKANLALGKLASADKYFRNSLEIRKRLAKTTIEPDHTQALRDLSVSLNQIGDTAKAAGKITDAEKAYKESLNIRRKISEDIGETPETLRDLSVSLIMIGNTALETNQKDKAREHYAECQPIIQRLKEIFPESDEYSRMAKVISNTLKNL